MSDVPVVPEVKEEPKPTAPKTKSRLKKPAARKKAAKKPLTKKSVKKAQQKVGPPSAKTAPERKSSRKPQRKPFPYARVLKMWKAGEIQHGDCENGWALRIQSIRPHAFLQSDIDPFP